MTMTDPIADMLTRIRNGSRSGHPEVDVPCSKAKMGIADVMKRKGFIRGWEKIDDAKQGILRISLKYGENGEQVITGIKRVSKPSLRVWKKTAEMPDVYGGVGVAIISTSSGIKTDEECREENMGGEVLCYLW